MRRCQKASRVPRLRNQTTSRILGVLLILVCAANLMHAQPKRRADFVLNSPLGSATGIRFFYYSGGDVIDGPVIFRPAEHGSPELNAAAAGRAELSTYVSFDEMSQLMERLKQLNLPWKESKKVKAFKPFSVFDEPSVKVDIQVVSSAGTAKAKLDGSLACEKLTAFDSAIQTRRALLDFQAFRSFMGCSVSGFDPSQYMQMISREHAPKPQQSSPK